MLDPLSTGKSEPPQELVVQLFFSRTYPLVMSRVDSKRTTLREGKKGREEARETESTSEISPSGGGSSSTEKGEKSRHNASIYATTEKIADGWCWLLRKTEKRGRGAKSWKDSEY